MVPLTVALIVVDLTSLTVQMRSTATRSDGVNPLLMHKRKPMQK
jgi:hypothetical protein